MGMTTFGCKIFDSFMDVCGGCRLLWTGGTGQTGPLVVRVREGAYKSGQYGANCLMVCPANRKKESDEACTLSHIRR